MWAYKYYKTRKQKEGLEVPKFGTFLKYNHDITRMWYQEVSEPPEDRVSFLLRLLRYIGHLCLLFIALYLVISPEDKYYD